MSKLLILADPSCSPKKLKLIATNGSQPIRWLFLGQDYSCFEKWAGELGSNFELINLDGQLKKTADHLRSFYLDFITEIGRKNNTEAWWASIISERNTAVSSLFLYCCYLKITLEQIGEFSDTLCIICESEFVLESLLDIAKQAKISTVPMWHSTWFKLRLLFWFRVFSRIGRLFYFLLIARFFGRDSLNINKTKRNVLVHTFVDDGCFGENGIFFDRYFPNLQTWLEKKGFVVNILPVLFNIKRSYVSAWRWIRGSKNNFINPFRYYRISDLFYAIKVAQKSYFMPNGVVKIDGMDVTKLFQAERKCHIMTRLEVILYLCLPYRLQQKGYHADIVICEYENMVPEKLLNLGFRKHSPKTKIVGFQHGALYPLLLCFFVTKGESDFAPLPDRVVCNGDFFREILLKEGLPAEKAVVGPSLRYTHLWHPVDKKIEDDKSFDVFVPLPLMISDRIELWQKLVRVFEDLPEIKVVLNQHPMAQTNRATRNVFAKMPSNFKLVNGAMKDWMRHAKLVIAMSSSSIYEALAFGLPVIVVGRQASIDLNPLGFFPGQDRVFYTTTQIREEALRILSMSNEEIFVFQKWGGELLRKSFNPVTEDSLRVFIDGIV